MTAPAAAPASGPIAPPAPRASPQPPADRFAFAAVLDSLPGAAAKAGASAAEEQPHPSKSREQEEFARGQSTRHSLLNDGALLASLPFALRAASAMDEGSQAADHASSLAPAATKASGAEASGAPVAAGAKAAAVGRLIGERAFHFGASAGAIGEPCARGRRAVRAAAGASGQTLRPKRAKAAKAPSPPASRMAARPCRRNLRGRRSSERSARGPGADRSPSSRALVNGSRRAPTRATRRKMPPTADASPKSRRRRRSPGLRVPPRPLRQRSRAASRTTAAFPIRPRPQRPRRRKPVRLARSSRRLSPRASFGPDASTASAAGADVTPRASALAASPAAAGSAGQGDRRRSFAGRPRGRLDDDAARRRQALGRHPRREFSDPKFNRRSARRDRRSHGGDRPAARIRSLSSRWASTLMRTRTETRLPPTTARRGRHGDRRKARASGAARTMRACLGAALVAIAVSSAAPRAPRGRSLASGR